MSPAAVTELRAESADPPLIKISLLAHDLANQLVGVVARLSLLAERDLAHGISSDLAAVVAQVRGARETVAEILQTARGEERERFALEKAAARAAKLALGDPPTVAFEVRGGRQPTHVLATRTQIERLLESVLAGEREALRREGDGWIRCEVQRQGSRAVLAIRSNAAPLTREDANPLFHPLNLRNPPDRGSGLGFGVCSAIARTHGGTFSLTPVPSGRRWELDLPLLLEAPAADEQFLRGDGAPKSVARGHFLVVDDEAVVRESCRMILGHLGCTCETVGSAAEAVKLVGDRRFDGAIVDLHLGGAHCGREVLEQIRSHRPELLGRTVLTTGDATAPTTLDLAGRFRLRILAKPFGVRELRAVLGQA